MKIMVIDVAAEYGGALTILNMFRERYEQDSENQYVFLLSRPHFQDTKTVRYMNFEWVKKSVIYRLFFDYLFVKWIIYKERPDKILSLQNNGIACGNIPQEIYFHNALLISDKKYKWSESNKLWIYQNIISLVVKKSIKRAEKIYVQAEWIKEKLSNKWRIAPSKIEVKRPNTKLKRIHRERVKIQGCPLFYPANTECYKNHITLLKACINVWEQYGDDCGLTLSLTCCQNEMDEACQLLIQKNNYPISFLGRLSREEMEEMYLQNILIFPSMIETVGLPLIEASHFGCEIIAADLEYAHEALNGYCKVNYFIADNENDLRRIILEKL